MPKSTEPPRRKRVRLWPRQDISIPRQLAYGRELHPHTFVDLVAHSQPVVLELYHIRVVNWARNYNQRTAGEAGSIKGIPDQLVIFKGCCHVEHHRPTGTDVDRAKGPQIGPVRLRKDIVESAPTAHSWQGE